MYFVDLLWISIFDNLILIVYIGPTSLLSSITALLFVLQTNYILPILLNIQLPIINQFYFSYKSFYDEDQTYVSSSSVPSAFHHLRFQRRQKLHTVLRPPIRVVEIQSTHRGTQWGWGWFFFHQQAIILKFSGGLFFFFHFLAFLRLF